MIKTLDNSNFKQETSSGIVLIDFAANWCGPCKMTEPILEELSNELPDGKKIVKINVDESPEISAAFRIRSIPTMVVLRDGEEMVRRVGATPDKDFYLDLMNEY